AHIHLELSALRFRVPPAGKFIFWVRQLLKKRQELSPLEIKESARIASLELLKEGIGILGEVTNSALTVEVLKDLPMCGYIFQEVISFRGNYTLKELKEFSPKYKVTYSAHAPYTVSSILLQAIKAYNQKRRKIFTIHCAESGEEVEFLLTGRSPLAELLKERGQWNESFNPPKTSPVKYLDSLGLLTGNTLLIHAIHLDEEDFQILAQRGVKVCLCPRSNLYTGVGFPNLPKFLKYNIPLLIGTDSLASNDRLSIFEEIKTLYSHYPDVSPLALLQMATSYGAKVLGFEEYGSFKIGSFANFIVVKTSTPLPTDLKKALEEFIITEKEVKYRGYATYDERVFI
ncbi:MAG: amidohydrolase family protein, partial [Caldimicrobium sp.]